MDYLVQYEDGSSGYLSHHGIKGMKWGVWNSETSARYKGSKPDPQVYKAANRGQALGSKLREKYSVDGEYSDKSWNAVTKSISREAGKLYSDKDVVEGKYKNFVNAAYDSVNHGSSAKKRLAGEWYLDRLLGSEERTMSLNRKDRKVSKASDKQKHVSSKYGADSRKNQKALGKYAKAKAKYEAEYKKLNPQRSEFYRNMD